MMREFTIIGHVVYFGSRQRCRRNAHVVRWWMWADERPSFADLELNGMGCSDKGEIPPPLPVKGSTADYGNLLDNQDLTSPSTPPPPPPHQRVGVLIRAERSSLMMHGTYNETRGWYTHLTFGSTSFTVPYPCTSCRHVPHSSSASAASFLVPCVTEECWHQSVSSKGPHPPVHPAVIYACPPPTTSWPGAQTWLIGWLLYL